MDGAFPRRFNIATGDDLGVQHRQPENAGDGHSRDMDLLDAYSRAVVGAAETISPAVVGISVRRPAASGDPDQAGAGSGVIVTPDGYILTNAHVIQQTARLTATLHDGSV